MGTSTRPHQHPAVWSLWSSAWWLWLLLCVTLVGMPRGVWGQLPPTAIPPSPQPPTAAPPTPLPPTAQPPTPLPPTVNPPTPIPPTAQPPTPLPPTVQPPTPIPPTAQPPTPIPPTAQPPTPIPPTAIPPTPIPTTASPPPVHPDDNTRFFLIEVRLSVSARGPLAALNNVDVLGRRVKTVLDVVVHGTGGYTGLTITQFYKVVGEHVLLIVLKSEKQATSSLQKLGEKVRAADTTLALVVAPLTSFEAFARALGAGTALTDVTSAGTVLEPSLSSHCYVLEFKPRATSTAFSATSQLKQVTTLILQRRQSGQRIQAYKLLAVTNVQFFICANTLLSDFDRMFLDLWAITDQPDVTSISSVREVQSVNSYLQPAGSGGQECNGFWCYVW